MRFSNKSVKSNQKIHLNEVGPLLGGRNPSILDLVVDSAIHVGDIYLNEFERCGRGGATPEERAVDIEIATKIALEVAEATTQNTIGCNRFSPN